MENFPQVLMTRSAVAIVVMVLLASGFLLTAHAYGKNNDTLNQHQQSHRKYSVYVYTTSYDFSALKRSLVGALQFWEKNDNASFTYAREPQDASFTVRGILESDGPYSAYTINERKIEVGLGDSRCNGTWREYDAKFVSTLLEHEVGHVLGHKHDKNPANVMHPFVLNASYKPLNQTLVIKPNKTTIVMACTFSGNPSFHYKVVSEHDDMFDVYFVKTNMHQKFMKNTNQAYRNEEGCKVLEPEPHEGICKNVDSNSALAIIPHSSLSTSLTVNVFVEEIH